MRRFVPAQAKLADCCAPQVCRRNPCRCRSFDPQTPEVAVGKEYACRAVPKRGEPHGPALLKKRIQGCEVGDALAARRARSRAAEAARPSRAASRPSPSACRRRARRARRCRASARPADAARAFPCRATARSSRRRQAGVAGHHGRRGRCQVDRRRHEVLDAAERAHRDSRQHEVALLRRVHDAPHQQRVDERRPDAVDADAHRRQFNRHRLGQPLQRVLGHAVDRAVGRAHVPHLRGDVDDGAALLARAGSSSILRAAACAATKAARTLRSSMASRCASLTSTNGSGKLVPALLTRMSRAAEPRHNGAQLGRTW